MFWSLTMRPVHSFVLCFRHMLKLTYSGQCARQASSVSDGCFKAALQAARMYAKRHNSPIHTTQQQTWLAHELVQSCDAVCGTRRIFGMDAYIVVFETFACLDLPLQSALLVDVLSQLICIA